jgi:hypothetical protein
MNVIELKSSIVNKINKISDQVILEELSEFVDELKKSEGTDFWNDLTKSQKESIEISRKQIKEGKTVSHEDVREEVKGRLKK